MKLQILELPMEHLGDATRTPFVVVFSEVSDITFKTMNDPSSVVREEFGVRGVFYTSEEVEIVR